MMEQKVRPDEERKIWKIRIDGSANKIGCKIRMWIITSNGAHLTNSIIVAF